MLAYHALKCVPKRQNEHVLDPLLRFLTTAAHYILFEINKQFRFDFAHSSCCQRSNFSLNFLCINLLFWSAGVRAKAQVVRYAIDKFYNNGVSPTKMLLLYFRLGASQYFCPGFSLLSKVVDGHAIHIHHSRSFVLLIRCQSSKIKQCARALENSFDLGKM